MSPVIEPGGFEIEHDLDPRDMADTFAVLDDGEMQVGPIICRWCHQTPCDCEPISGREFRQMAARYDGSPARYQP